MKASHSWLLLILCASAGQGIAQHAPAASAAPVAVLVPDQRPANAPRITAPLPLDKARALYGVTEPKPASLKFLDDQGGWYTPFSHPGMTPPYDPRGWHARSAPSAK